MRYKKWLKLIFVVFFSFLFLIAGFNYVVDPFDIYKSAKINGFTTKKPEFFSHLRMTKAHEVYRIKPQAVALGTSTTETGIDPEHPGWSKNAFPRYNLGLSAANVYEIMSYLKYAQSISPLKQVVIGFDFFSFNIHVNNGADFVEERLQSNCNMFLLKEKIQNLISIDTLRLSFKTLREQERLDIMEYLPNGQRAWDYKRNRKNALGHRQMFRDYEKEAVHSSWECEDVKTKKSTLDIFREMLVFSYDNDINLYLFISPSHARNCEVIKVCGFWQKFEDWKRSMVQIANEEASIHGKKAFLIWDFADYNELTTEDVPLPQDKNSDMKYHWETSHYKKELGDMVLDRIFSYDDPGRNLHEDFGTILRKENLEEHLLEVRQRQKQYKMSHPQDIIEIKELWEKHHSERKSKLL
jgi:hypothetical protein